MEAADADVNGLIDYEEFVTATVHMNKMDREEHLYTTFQFFDKDNSGYITRDEIKQAFKEKGMYGAKEIKEIISEADTVKISVVELVDKTEHADLCRVLEPLNCVDAQLV
ncbi:calcium-dependent protein kinase 17-like [Hordeum vulgare]|nr:calcium-dependent protein kinase 17-like [Hordeum vulgare]